jgi:hypothetical protein
MRIDVELTDDETALLLLMLGAGTASLELLTKIDSMLSIANKLMSGSPDYTPYQVSDLPKRVH